MLLVEVDGHEAEVERTSLQEDRLESRIKATAEGRIVLNSLLAELLA